MFSLMNLVKYGIVGVISGGASQLFGAKQDSSIGILSTFILGVGGAVLGGYVGQQFGFGHMYGFDGPSFLAAVGGGVFLVLVKSQFVR